MSSMRDLLMSPIRRHRGLHYWLRNAYFAPGESRKALRARPGCRGRRLPLVMIVGCSRSGTSFAARMLASAGLHLPGEHTLPDGFNPHGYFEEHRVVAVNSDILRGSQGHWHSPPQTLRVYAYQRAQIEQLLGWLCGSPDIAGWKDPRGTLTLPVWLDAARALDIPVQVVGVFRAPAAVASSIVCHEGGAVGFDQALQAWCAHNERLLDLAAALPDRFSWFTVDQLAARAEANLNAIAHAIGLPRRVQMDRGGRVQAGASFAAINRHADAVYRRLRAAHATQWYATGARVDGDAG